MVLVGCSMCLSGYFGWVIGEGVFPLNVVLALMCAAVAFGVSMMFERAAGYNVVGYRGNAIVCWMIGALFLAANVLFDYSSAAAVRDAVATAATNQNNKAADVRGQIDLLRKNIDDAKRTTTWQAALQPATAYESEIHNLEGDRTIMARSKGCTDQTRDDTRAHCQKISDARANLAMAQQKKTYEGQIERWERELGQLTAKAETTLLASNPAVAQVKAIVSWVVQTKDVTETNIFWGQNAVMLLMTVLVNAGLAFLGNEIGTMRGADYVAASRESEHHDIEPRRLSYVSAPAREPAREHAREAGRDTTETIILAGTEAGDVRVHAADPNADEILRRAQDAAARARSMLEQMKAMGTA